MAAFRHLARAALAAAAALFAAQALAATKRYTFEIPDRVPAAYEVSFDVGHPGKLVIDTRWNGGRVLSFRLEGPGSPPVRMLRSGPSPQRIEVTLAEGSASVAAGWRLLVRALPGKGSAQVDLALEVPDAAAAAPAAAATVAAAPKPEDEREPWARPAVAGPTVSPTVANVYQAIERFRSAIVQPDGEFESDPCSWHAGFLARMASLRDGMAAGSFPFSAVDRTGFARLSGAVRRVHELRTSKDPLIAGPVPTDARERIVWRARRGDRIRPLEEDLDALLSDLRAEKVFERLTEDIWPSRFAACLLACERYFEESVRIGDEAANAELARSEWDRYLEAARIFEALITTPGRAEAGTPASEGSKPSVP